MIPNTKEEILASLAKKDEMEKRSKNLSMDDVEHLLKEREAKVRAEYADSSRPSEINPKVIEGTITKKNAALEVCKVLFEKRMTGLIVTLGTFGVYIAAINPKLKMIITLAFIGFGLFNLVTAHFKLKQLNDRYKLGLKLDFKMEAPKK